MRLNDLTGRTFGRLVVLTRASNDPQGKAQWLCRCVCGKTKVVRASNLKKGNTTSCGCFRRECRLDDLVGRRFGRLVVHSRGASTKNGGTRWTCLCDCGKFTRPVSGYDLKAGKVVSCGCFNREQASERFRKDIAGQRFGKLVAIKCVGKNKHGVYIWQCVCDCGGSVKVDVGALHSRQRTSCGCARSQARQRRVPDLTGQQFGRWLVISRAPKGPRGLTRWRCQCSCGGTVSKRTVDAKSLLNGTSRSCGCLQSQIASSRLLDLTGKRFGRLLVVSQGQRTSHGRVTWVCLCDCGNTETVRSHSLTKGETQSCGCLANELSSARGIERIESKTGMKRLWLYESDSQAILMRSSWEVLFARWLDGQGEPWRYEPKVFRLAGSTRYVPDFFLPDREIWVEVKGRLVEKAQHKIDLFRLQHPLILVRKKFLLRLTGATNLQQISNMVRRIDLPPTSKS